MESNRKLLIKGMVCERCISVVKTELSKAGFETSKIQLGEITLAGSVGAEQARVLAEKLEPFGFSLVEDKREKIVQQVIALMKEVYSGNFDFPNSFRFSDLASQRLGLEYDKISVVFSELEKKTLEKYIIEYRIERVKALLVNSNSSLADISFNLGFSSVPHLSRQFKEFTGITPSQFKASGRTAD